MRPTTEAARGFTRTGQVVTDLAINLLVFSPFWVPPVALGVAVWRRYNGRRPPPRQG